MQRADRVPHAGEGDRLFDRARHSEKWRQRLSVARRHQRRLGVTRLGPRRLETQLDHSVEARVDGRDARRMRVHDFERRDDAPPDRRRQRRGAHPQQILSLRKLVPHLTFPANMS